MFSVLGKFVLRVHLLQPRLFGNAYTHSCSVELVRIHCKRPPVPHVSYVYCLFIEKRQYDISAQGHSHKLGVLYSEGISYASLNKLDPAFSGGDNQPLRHMLLL